MRGFNCIYCNCYNGCAPDKHSLMKSTEIEWKMEKHHSSSHCASARVKHTLPFTPFYHQCALTGDTCRGGESRSRNTLLYSKWKQGGAAALCGLSLHVLGIKQLITNRLAVKGERKWELQAGFRFSTSARCKIVSSRALE